LISEMNLQDESIPILKVRHLRRLKDNTSPNPPFQQRWPPIEEKEVSRN
jgi:hypothetical protein